MGEKRTNSQPFFAFITPNAPHAPYVSPGERYSQPYAQAGLNKDEAAYYGMISNIDENVGRLLAQLKEWDLERSTLIIFMTDNGHPFRNLYNAGMRGTKGKTYQGGTRVPSFWRWPGALKAGTDVDNLTAHIDVLPTLAQLAGAKLPSTLPLDGRSLVPLLLNPDADWADRFLFTHTGRWTKGKAIQSKFSDCAVRSRRFRLVNNSELFDLQADPGETRNVIANHGPIVAQMRAAYAAWWSEVLPALENEDAMGPNVNPFKELYWKQVARQ